MSARKLTTLRPAIKQSSTPMIAHPGEFAALTTAFCWTITSMSFQQATRKIGTLAVNLLRLLIAFILFGTVNFLITGHFFPISASSHAWTWLSVSGLVGFVFGDYFLFRSYHYVSARISMLIMAVSPLFAAIISYFILDESMGWTEILSMFITIAGIFLVVLSRQKSGENEEGKSSIRLAFPAKGLLFALGGAIGQAGGLVLSKYGMTDTDPFAATQIRVIAGLVGFTIIIVGMRRWNKVFIAFKDKKAMLYTLTGGIFGPFLGVYLSLYSIKYTSIGIGSTIMAIVPVLIIPLAILVYKEKVSLKEVIGAILAVAGVSFFFIF